MDPTLALLLGLPVPLLDSFGKADNVLPFVMLEQLQRRASVDGARATRDGEIDCNPSRAC